jgi:hypothetical protein
MIEIYFRCFHKRRPKISSSFPSSKPPYMPRESISVFHRHFKRLLLSDKEFGNLSWEPPGRLEEFCRERLCPALLLVHRCTLEGTNPRIISTDIPPEEKDELRVILLRLVGTIVSAGFSLLFFF